MAIHLLEALHRIRAHGPADPWTGICGNVARVCGYGSTAAQQLEALIATWPDRASDDRFPVEGSLFEYLADDNKWQNPRRLALLDWLIAQLEGIHCAECDSTDIALVTGATIYPHRTDLHNLHFWQCQCCEAYVGTHKGTTTPLGTPASAPLRRLRVACHKKLDAIWIDSPDITRSQAYDMMQDATGVSHIGKATEDDCKKVLQWLDSL